MQTEFDDTLWLDHSQRVSISDLVDLSGLSENEIHELVDCGALAPVNEAIPWSFSAQCVVTVRTASRLRNELELDSHALVLALTLLQQIRALETELVQLRAQMPLFRRF